MDWAFSKDRSSDTIGIRYVGYGTNACLGSHGVGQLPNQIDDVSLYDIHDIVDES
jgi:hypothetical protein